MHDDRRERQRVAANIGAVVLAFCCERLRIGGQFHMQELNEWVQAKHPSAPASADRILRQLRSEGKVAYEVLNRSESLYQLKEVMPDGEGQVRPSPARHVKTPPRGDVGGVPRGLFDGPEWGSRRGLDAIRGR